MNAFSIPAKSCMANEQNNKARTPTRNQMIVLSPRKNRIEAIIDDTFWHGKHDKRGILARK